MHKLHKCFSCKIPVGNPMAWLPLNPYIRILIVRSHIFPLFAKYISGRDAPVFTGCVLDNLSQREMFLYLHAAANTMLRGVLIPLQTAYYNKREVFMLNGKKEYCFIRLVLTASCVAFILCSCSGNTGSTKTAADASVSTHTQRQEKYPLRTPPKGIGQAEQGGRDEKRMFSLQGESEISEGTTGRRNEKKDVDKRCEGKCTRFFSGIPSQKARPMHFAKRKSI